MSIRTTVPGHASADEPEDPREAAPTSPASEPRRVPAPEPVAAEPVVPAEAVVPPTSVEDLPTPVEAPGVPVPPAQEAVVEAPLAPEPAVPSDRDAPSQPEGEAGGPIVAEGAPESDAPGSPDAPADPGTVADVPGQAGSAAQDLLPVPTQDLAPVPPAPSPPAVAELAPSIPAAPVARRGGDVEAVAPVDAPAPLDPGHDAPAEGGSGSGGPGPADPPAGGSGRGRKPKKDPEGRMALREHLTELRKRVVRAGLFVLLGAVAGWFLYDPVINYMTAPLQELRAEDGSRLISINFNNVGASFDLKLKGAVWIGFIVSSPFWIYQLWAFITPGLTKRERRYAVGFVAAAVPLFLGGVYLASLFIPRAVAFLTSFTPDGATNLTDAPSYIGFILRTVLTFGLAFLLPVVLVALNFAGLLSGRAVLKAWRWVLVACFTFAAIATPTPDVTAMFTLAAPIIILFLVAIVICLLHDRRKARREPSYAGLDDDAASDLGDDEASPL